MPTRPTWTGFLRLSLVTLPVRAYSASSAAPALNQLHARKDCYRRIRYQKTCPEHGAVRDDEIVRAFEHEAGKYVPVDRAELKEADDESGKALSIDGFFPVDALDEIALRGNAYYVVPDGPAGKLPFALLERAMRELGQCAIARGKLFQRQQLLWIRPYAKVLLMCTLRYANEVRDPEEFMEDAGGRQTAGGEELKLTKMLVKASMHDKLDLAQYRDESATLLKQLVESKVAQDSSVTPADTEAQTPSINLMDALRRSMRQSPRAKVKKSATGHTRRRSGRRAS